MKRLILFSLILLFSCEEDFLYDENITSIGSKNAKHVTAPVACIDNYHKFDYPKADFSIIEKRNDVMWGINGHSIHADTYIDSTGIGHDCQYREFSIQEQVDFIKSLGLNVYRTDVYVNESGVLYNSYDSPQRFSELLNSLDANNINLMPLIDTYPVEGVNLVLGSDWSFQNVKNYIINNNSNGVRSLEMWHHYYQKGNSTGSNFAAIYGPKLKYYNVGNEIACKIVKFFPLPICNLTSGNTDNYVCFMNNTPGHSTEILDFFQNEIQAQRVVASAAYINGIIDGIKASDRDAKLVVNDGEIVFGYYKFLNFMNTKYDILGWNYYSDDVEFNSNNGDLYNFNIYQQLNLVGNGKPIWITETNRWAGSRNYSGESVISAQEKQSNKIRERMIELSQLPNIKAVFIYELIDQKEVWDTRWQNYYGLISDPFKASGAYKKPAFNTYRFSIEELKYGYHDLMYSYYKLYANYNKELIGDTAIEYWSNQLKNGGNISNILNNIIDIDSFYFINKSFIDILDRTQNPPYEIALNFRDEMVEGKTREWFIGHICSSTEFFNKSQLQNYPTNGNQTLNFIYHVFNKLVGYSPNPSEIQALLNDYPNIANNSSERYHVVQRVLNKPEYKRKFIIEQFQIYMERDVESTEPTAIDYHLSVWTNQKDFLIRLMSHDEFWRKSVIRGYCIRYNL